MENNSRSELGSLKKQHFGKVPNILNSLFPSGPICVTVTHELSLTLLTSGFWLRLDSRATVRGQDNPKDVSSPLMPLWESLIAAAALLSEPHQWKHFAQTGQPCMQPEIGQDQTPCVKTKTSTADLV